MSTATEQNFPIGSEVIVNDPAHHLNGKPGIVESHYGDFGIRVRLSKGQVVDIDSSCVRLLEKTTVETVQGYGDEARDDTDIAEEAKTPLRDKIKVFGIPLAIGLVTILAVVFSKPEPKPEPAPIQKTEKELAVERINGRNLKIAPISDSCVTLEELKRANESDLRILYPAK